MLLTEPSQQDDTYAGRDEHALDWLFRSTNTRARACRCFLNENIARLPVETQQLCWRALRDRWHSAFFELIVARLLQELGSTISIEVEGQNSKRPDFLAQFPDSTVIVEAVSPVINASTGDEAVRRIPLLDFIESKTPIGWSIGVFELPNLGPADSKKDFRATIERMLNIPPPRDKHHELDLVEQTSSGIIHLRLWPKVIGTSRLLIEPAFSTVDNSEVRIRNAVKRKKGQLRAQGAPVVLAINASGISSSLEDFDQALFGRSYAMATSPMIQAGFRSDGVLVRSHGSSPTIAGVLAFLDVGFPAGPLPVLYLHPAFSGILPEAFLNLEQRTFDALAQEIVARPAQATNVLEGLRYVSREECK